MSEHTNYNNYEKKLIKASRQAGKSTIHLAQVLNWLSFQDHPQDFKPLKFDMVCVNIEEIDK